MLYIDKINEKTIRIKEVKNGYVSSENDTFATFQASVGVGGLVTVKDMYGTGVSYSVGLAELYIDGALAPQKMDDAISALEFIGNFKSPGGTGTTNPAEWGDIGGDIDSQSDLKDRLTVLNSKIDGMINDSDLDSVTTTVSASRTMHIPVAQAVNKDRYNVVKVKTVQGTTSFNAGDTVLLNGVSCTIPELSFNPTSSKLLNINAYMFAYGGGKYVVFGAGAKAYYSEDRINWTETDLPSSGSWYGLRYANGRFVALKFSSTVAAYSDDGITWIETLLPHARQWLNLISVNNEFYAIDVQYFNHVLHSADGINWSDIYVGTGDGSGSGYGRALTHGNGKFVVISKATTKAFLFVSTDFINWTKYDVVNSINDTSIIVSISFINGSFFILTNQFIYKSEDLENWTKISLTGINSNAFTTGILQFGNKIVVASDNTMAFSEDGVLWESIYIPNAMKYIFYENGKLFSTGGTGLFEFEYNLLPENSTLILNDPGKAYDNDPAGTYTAGTDLIAEIQTSYLTGSDEILSKMKYVSEVDPLVQKSYLEMLLKAMSDAEKSPITLHNLLDGRSDFYCHPIDSIDGLKSALDGFGSKKHNDFSGRDETDCHPIDSISGLTDSIEGLLNSINTKSSIKTVTGKTKQEVIDLSTDNPGVLVIASDINMTVINGNEVLQKYPIPDLSKETILLNLTATTIAGSTATVPSDGFIIFDGYRTSAWTTGVYGYIDNTRVFVAFLNAASTIVSAPIFVQKNAVIKINSPSVALSSIDRLQAKFYPIKFIYL